MPWGIGDLILVYLVNLTARAWRGETDCTIAITSSMPGSAQLLEACRDATSVAIGPALYRLTTPASSASERRRSEMR